MRRNAVIHGDSGKVTRPYQSPQVYMQSQHLSQSHPMIIRNARLHRNLSRADLQKLLTSLASRQGQPSQTS